jgi:sensor domain CHASE-containing protein
MSRLVLQGEEGDEFHGVMVVLTGVDHLAGYSVHAGPNLQRAGQEIVANGSDRFLCGHRASNEPQQSAASSSCYSVL